MYDRSAQLTAMNFSAEETSNIIVMQASIAGGLIGAILGAIMAYIGQGLFD